MEGDQQELLEICLRYVTKSELKAMLDEMRSEPEVEGPAPGSGDGAPPSEQAGNGG